MIEFERIRPVINPHCSNVQRASGYLQDIYDAFPKFYGPGLEPIFTSANAEETIERIRCLTQPGDLVPIIGGDGTIGVTAQAIAGRDITAMTLWAGNGNDGSRDLNGEAGERPIHELIRDGHTATIYPVDIIVEGLRRQFINYLGIGSTAKGARLLNTERWRNLPGYQNDTVRAAYEWLALPPVGFFSRQFTVDERGREKRDIVELTIANAAYMAKHAKPPVRLSEPRAFITEATNPLTLLPWAIRGTRGTSRGEFLEKGSARHVAIGRTVLAHADAEPFVIEKGSAVTLAIADTPFYAVSTRIPD